MLICKKIILLLILIVLALTNANAYIWSKPEEIGVLSQQDADYYKEIFVAQQQRRYDDADEILDKVSNNILKNYVLYDRYMSKDYKTKPNELSEWLYENNDSALSPKISKLLKNKGHKVPVSINYAPDFKVSADGTNEMIRNSYNNLSTSRQKYIKKQISSFKKAINSGNTKTAKNILQDSKFYKYMNQNDLDRMAGILTFSYFLDNEYELAREVGKTSAQNGEYNSAYALGLINYKNHNFEIASKYFVSVYDNVNISSFQRSQGAYWASRCFEELDNKETQTDKYLNSACDIPYSFYGAIACEKLGKFKSIKWDDFDFTIPEITSILQNYPNGEAALALLQVGKREYAIAELITIAKKYHEQDSVLVGSIIGLSQKINVPNLSIQLSRSLKEKDLHKYHSAAYPIPGYSSKDWKLDRAFVYAIAKQESLFNEYARSNVGACGLMQIMPSTAAYIAKDLGLKKNKERLYDPEYNLSLGQEYMSYLLEKEHRQDPDLIKVLVSYNAGPGNYRKWDKKVICNEDPLLFIESVPSKETRNYVKNVLLNLWFYRSRFNQDNPSLSNLAEDQWPLYHHLDD